MTFSEPTTRPCPNPLPITLRSELEQAFNVDLQDVRLVSSPDLDEMLRALEVDGAAGGQSIYVRSDLDLGSDQGRRLLAHEVSHVVQQHRGLVAASDLVSVEPGSPGWFWEHEADRAAEAFVSGRPVELTQRRPAGYEPVGQTETQRQTLLQAHGSFEHRALGDVPTTDLVAVVNDSPAKAEILERQLKMIALWKDNPESVTEKQITAICPWIRTIKLETSGLIVTYGELNALPDYISTGAVADTIPKSILLPILQFIRQESFIKLSNLLGRVVRPTFKDSVMGPGVPFVGLLNKILESKAIDDLTAALGYNSTDHYLAVLARNACHFAPFSWHRWQSSHLLARDYAKKAHAATDSATKHQLTHQAWIHDGFADHFLQDSFAAGHLVNKTLIMQWFIEWVSDQVWPVADWDIVKLNTTKLQPGLAGRNLYDPGYDGLSNDPQTSEDQPTYAQRLLNTGVIAGPDGDLSLAYQNYMVFLASLITQSSSAAIHDYYNENSLWVGSKVHPEAIEIWGDDTLFTGTNGAGGMEQTSTATQLSQEAINELLSTGETAISTQSIRDHFPTTVRTDGSKMIGIEAWNDTQKAFCESKIFPGLHEIIVRLFSPRAENLSRDQDLTKQWESSLPDTGFTITNVVENDTGLFLASSGKVFEVDRHSGAITKSLKVGSGETRLTHDGASLYAGFDGKVARVDPSDWAKPKWSIKLPKGKGIVSVLAGCGSLYASSNGYVHKLDPSNGKVAKTYQFSSMFGVGDYTARMALQGKNLIVGSHGYVYAVDTSKFKAVWSADLSGAGYNPVDVVAHGGYIYAGCNGHAYAIEADHGNVKEHLLVTSKVGVGDYSTRVATDGTTLFVGVHGWAYGIKLNSWKKAKWETDLKGSRWTRVSLAAVDGQLLAGAHGYLYRLDPDSGRLVRSLLMASVVGVGDYQTEFAVDLARHTAFVGVHGYGYAISVNNEPSPGR